MIELSLPVENTKIYNFVKAMPIWVTQLTFDYGLEIKKKPCNLAEFQCQNSNVLIQTV